MSLRIVGLGSAIAGLLAVPAAFAIGSAALDAEFCDSSSIHGEYKAPEQIRSAALQIKKGVPVEELAARQAELHQWLSTSQPSLQQATPLSVELNRADRIAIGDEDCVDCYQLQIDQRRYQVGVAKDVGVDIDFGGVDFGRLPKNGSWMHNNGVIGRGADGEMVWTAVIESAGATALRVGFENFKLPGDAEMYVYTDHGEAFGPYREWGPNDSGEFWSNTTAGSRVYLQLHYFGAATPENLAALDFNISGIGHMGPRFKLARHIKPEAFGEKAFCSFNEDCVENVNCTSNSAVSDARKALAEMIYQSGSGYYICSGGLMADTDSGSLVPYFLTANHCISKGSEASSLETVFDFEVSCGTSGSDCPRYGDGFNVRTLGASIVATNSTSDYTLLQLAETPGGTRAYLGWDNAEIAFTHGAKLYRVSHPSGAPQAYSAHEVDTSKGTCRTWPRGNWIYSHDLVGATEGGSSGSPVVNAGGQVVGQLSGGCGTNVNDVCDTTNNATVDGAFAAYWGDVQPFLDPSGDGGGDDGGDDGDDGGDDGGQCDLLPTGSQCTSDSECCSNKCKGKPGSRTCK